MKKWIYYCKFCGSKKIAFSERKTEYACFSCKQKAKQRKVNISDRIRWDVWERDNFTCQLCGSRRYLTVDHIYPESKGGTLEMSNLQTLCKRCNSKKGPR